MSSNGNGKGSDARNCHTDAFRSRYDDIDWRTKPKPKPESTKPEAIAVPVISPTTEQQETKL